MAQVYPFPAYRYNASKVAYDRVLTQPYDKISPSMQEKYYAADPHNLIAVEKGRVLPGDTPLSVPNEKNVYTRAAEALHDWIREQIVVQDTRPCFYSYTQEYTVPGTADAIGKGERRTRRGFIGAGKLEEYSANVVFRHEHTLSGPKADRLELLRHTGMHTGQLFLLYSDAERLIDTILSEAEAAAPPATELTDEYGVIHRLWVVWEPERVEAIRAAMTGQQLVIADGHHRYETALNFRNERRKQSAREQGLPERAEAQDSTATDISPFGTSPAANPSAGNPATANSPSGGHVGGAAASVATAAAASLATGVAGPGAAAAGSIAVEPVVDGAGALNAAPYEAAMMTFVNTRTEGLTILPTHRVVANLPDFSWPNMRRYLEPWFAAEVFSFTDATTKAETRGRFLHRLIEARELRAIGVYPAGEAGKGAFYVLTLRPGANLVELLPTVSPLQRELDVVLLHDGILEPALGITLQAATAEKNLTYEREASAALDAVDRGAAQVAFLLNACSVDQVWEIATAGEVMPQKSTDFFPKLMSGITMYRV